MDVIDFETLRSTLIEYKTKKVMLTFHSIGDTDSVSSAFCLSGYFANSTISTPDFITNNSKRILGRLGFEESRMKKEFDSSADLIIMLDVNNFDDCGAFKEKLETCKSRILIIDHHISQVIHKGNVLSFNDESFNSTASIIYELLKPMGFMISRSIAELLVLGIVSDSAEFRNASYKTFIDVGELLDIANVDYASLLPVMQHMASTEARQASAKDLFGSKIGVVSGLLLVSGIAKGHANQSADDAIRIGADVSLFHSINANEVSFSARLRPPLDGELNLHLGMLMRKLAPIIGGHGGGHPCAAGAYGPSIPNAEEFESEFVSEVARIVGSRYPRGYKSSKAD
jgi:nanoRNase/pAp phosphatase (c-di-AMP/oligoRNAs hydrolase)